MPQMIAELERNKAAAAEGRGGVAGLPRQPVDARPHGHHDDPVVAQRRRHLRLRELADHRAPAGVARVLPRGQGRTEAVTIWHETYAVQPGGAESVYAGRAPSGSAPWRASSRSVGAARRARERIGGTVA